MTSDTRWPFVSVTVVNYNTKELSEQCLNSLLKTNYQNFEVILVDNASSDGSLEYLREEFGDNPRLIFVRNKINLNIVGGYNTGIRLAKGEYIALLHNDTKVDPDWLVELVKVLNANPTIGMAQSKILKMNNPKIIDCAGGFLDQFGLMYKRGEGEEDKGQYNKNENIFPGHSPGLILRKITINKVGLIDKDFFTQHEILDWCWRIWISGYRVVFVPKSKIYHKGGGSEKKAQPYYSEKRHLWITDFHNNKNLLVMPMKNFELRNLVKFIPIYLFFLFVFSLYIALKNADAMYFFYAFLKPIIWNLSEIKNTWEKRSRVQYFREVRDTEIKKRFWRPKSILRKYTCARTEYCTRTLLNHCS